MELSVAKQLLSGLTSRIVGSHICVGNHCGTHGPLNPNWPLGRMWSKGRQGGISHAGLAAGSTVGPRSHQPNTSIDLCHHHTFQSKCRV